MDRFKKTQKETFSAKESGKTVLWQIKKVLLCHFPDLQARLNKIPDKRKGIEYSIAELVMAAIVLFLFKCESRNEFNLRLKDEQFRRNYYRLFHLCPPSMDAVNNFFKILDPDAFEELHCRLVNALIEKRVLHKLRFFAKFFCIAIDGSGIYNWGATPPESIRQYALKKETKKDTDSSKVNYSTQVLEAVLVCSNGMVIPLLSEWIANDGEKYDKQDSELKAFKRLAIRLKKYFPRLSICILSDGLYTNVAMMDVCRQYGWNYITVFKDGNLPSVWEEVNSLLPLGGGAQTCQLEPFDRTCRIKQTYRWIKDIPYQKYSIHWLECVQNTVHRKTGEISMHRFVFLSNFEMDRHNVKFILMAGRARWSIEDHFNTQKNRGGVLHHKFNRNDFKAIKNWHKVRQLACMINELVEYTQELRLLLKENAKMTLKELWKSLNAFLIMCTVNDLSIEFESWSKGSRQVRLE